MKNHTYFEMSKFLQPQLRESSHEIDLYGFSEILEHLTGKKRPHKPLATWVHGWNFQPLSSPRVLSAFGEYLGYRRIVRSVKERDLLEAYGFTNVIIGGLPFQYVERSNFERKPGSLVVMGEHSLSLRDPRTIRSWQQLIDEVNLNYKNKFEEIVFCVISDDYYNSPVRQLLESNGYDVIIGGFKNDINSLLRLRQIFDYFEFGLTTCLGSHLLYAHFSGCKMAVSSKLFGICPLLPGQYGKNYTGKFAKNDEEILNNYILSETPRKDFEFLFSDDFINFKIASDWANREIGTADKICINQLADAIAWTGVEYLKAASRHLYDKVFQRRSI
jgi:hypothetical protein